MPDLTARSVALRYALTKESPTAESLAQFAERQLGPLFKEHAFSVYVQNLLGDASVSVQFFQAPKGAQDTVLWNSPKYIKVWIRGSGWKPGGAAPAKVEAIVVRSQGLKQKMRRTSGPPEKVLQSVVTWFRNNQKELTSGTDL